MSDCWRGRTANATGTWVGWDRCSRRAAHAGLTIRPTRTKAIVHQQVARIRRVIVIMARVYVGALPRYFKLWMLVHYNTMGIRRRPCGRHGRAPLAKRTRHGTSTELVCRLILSAALQTCLSLVHSYRGFIRTRSIGKHFLQRVYGLNAPKNTPDAPVEPTRRSRYVMTSRRIQRSMVVTVRVKAVAA